jgi:hypothetical protein
MSGFAKPCPLSRSRRNPTLPTSTSGNGTRRLARQKLAGSTWYDDFPAVAPSGDRVAFASNRTGENEMTFPLATRTDFRIERATVPRLSSIVGCGLRIA